MSEDLRRQSSENPKKNLRDKGVTFIHEAFFVVLQFWIEAGSSEMTMRSSWIFDATTLIQAMLKSNFIGSFLQTTYPLFSAPVGDLTTKLFDVGDELLPRKSCVLHSKNRSMAQDSLHPL